MNIDQLAVALYNEQVRYFKVIRRYDQDYNMVYEELNPENKDAFKNYAAWILTHKEDIFGIQPSTGLRSKTTV